MRLVVALTIAIACCLPGVAQAQDAPAPDERAAAQGFAAAAVRFQTETDRAMRGYEVPACTRELKRVPHRKIDVALSVVLVHSLRDVSARLRPALTQMRFDLAAVETRDAALISGRAAWRATGRAFDAIPAPGDLCADLAAARKASYPRSLARTADAELETILKIGTRGKLRRLQAAALRLRELGVPAGDAETFTGEAPVPGGKRRGW